MTQIETFQDRTSMGTFSQIKLDDGNKILISLTQTEIAILKVGFLGIPKGTLWKEDINTFLDIIYPEGPASKDTDKSVLEIATELAVTCKDLDEVKNKFEGLNKLGTLRNLVGELTEKSGELKDWQRKLKTVTGLLVDSFDKQYKTIIKILGGQNQEDGQMKEIIILSVVNIAWPVYAVFTEGEAKDVIENLKNEILNKYFSNSIEREGFEKLFWERWDEYAEVLDPNNENLILQIGGIFCDHFFGTRVSKVDIMGMIGMSFISSSKEIKHKLEEIKI